MNYTIETKENFDIISPTQSEFNSQMAEEIKGLVNNALAKKRSLILNLKEVTSTTNDISELSNFHHNLYQENLSFVLCHVAASLKNELQQHELLEELNITPTLIEAIDIVSMEGLERELLGEDF